MSRGCCALRCVIVAVVLSTPSLAAEVGPPRGMPLTGHALRAKTDEIAALLRCPVCQGLSVNDSHAEMAVNMKATIRDMLAAGYAPEQVLFSFESSYGEFVRLEPPLRGVNWLVWLAPAVGLAAGVAALVRAIRRGRRAAERADSETEPKDRDKLPEDAELAAYVLRVRERAYGWSGGVSRNAVRR